MILAIPRVARPDPMRPPTTVWVPEIGMPKKEDIMMMMKEEIDVPSIIFSMTSGLRESASSITLPTR